MKKYKLIKEYPGSPKIETVLSLEESKKVLGSLSYISCWPEFWEEVKEEKVIENTEAKRRFALELLREEYIRDYKNKEIENASRLLIVICQ